MFIKINLIFIQMLKVIKYIYSLNEYIYDLFYNINENHANIRNYVSLISVFSSFKNTAWF